MENVDCGKIKSSFHVIQQFSFWIDTQRNSNQAIKNTSVHQVHTGVISNSSSREEIPGSTGRQNAAHMSCKTAQVLKEEWVGTFYWCVGMLCYIK